MYYVAYLFLFGRTPGVSTTAQGPISTRWAQHHLGVRQDEAANRLMMALPGTPPLGLYLTGGPTLLAHRLTGYVPKAFRYPFEGEVPVQYEASARQTFFDGVVERYLANITQFVILGVGSDTRAHRLPKDARVQSFEVDTPKTQMVKRELLKKTGIDSTGVTFVSADFEKENWLSRLVQSCFDTEPLESNSLYWRYGRAATKAAGEPMKFGIDSTLPSRERLAELLQSCGLSLGEQRTLGQETEGKRAWGGFAVAIVK